VAPKAAKWALVGPVLSACGGQEGSLSEFSDSLRARILGSSLSRPFLFRAHDEHRAVGVANN
jgi:hypothetical protein